MENWEESYNEASCELNHKTNVQQIPEIHTFVVGVNETLIDFIHDKIKKDTNACGSKLQTVFFVETIFFLSNINCITSVANFVWLDEYHDEKFCNKNVIWKGWENKSITFWINYFSFLFMTYSMTYLQTWLPCKT